MSIPSYQFASLGAENIAKKRVMRKAQKGVETEEQRAVKSGQIADSIKNAYRAILANLELQKTTIIVTTAFVETMAYSEYTGEFERGYDGESVASSSEASSSLSSVEPKERELISFIVASLGKLVSLSTQLNNLIGALQTEIVKSGNPANPSVDIARIIELMEEVDRKYGEWGKTGLSKALATMIETLDATGQHPPQLDGLLELWEVSNSEARDALEKIQKNVYKVDLQRVNIPTKSTNAERHRGIREGTERRDFTGAEYKLMLELRKQGILSGDDFTSVYEGRGDGSTIGTDLSNAGFDYGSSSGGESDSGMYVDYGDSDDDSGYSGAGLYTIHPPVRRPAYDFPPFSRPLSNY